MNFERSDLGELTGLLLIGLFILFPQIKIKYKHYMFFSRRNMRDIKPIQKRSARQTNLQNGKKE